MKLYAFTGACSLGPHIALHELGLEHELELLKPKQGDLQSAEHLARNPLGMVPVLEFEPGKYLTECGAILQFLADRKPESGLAPAPTDFERYRLQEWLSFVATELHKSFYPLFFGSQILKEDQAARQQMVEFYASRLEKRWQVVSDRLGDREWLLESGYSVADIYLYVVLSWWLFLKRSLETWPNLASFVERMRARPAVAAAHRAEG
ncbi:MAG: glutathione S-transferase family protein [Candidatus Eremiobacteraeota bacterium]|nr:glutathione S-transferase family protein [Candidatus Eremiobacteraeota bacterium]